MFHEKQINSFSQTWISYRSIIAVYGEIAENTGPCPGPVCFANFNKIPAFSWNEKAINMNTASWIHLSSPKDNFTHTILGHLGIWTHISTSGSYYQRPALLFLIPQ